MLRGAIDNKQGNRYNRRTDERIICSGRFSIKVNLSFTSRRNYDKFTFTAAITCSSRYDNKHNTTHKQVSTNAAFQGHQI